MDYRDQQRMKQERKRLNELLKELRLTGSIKITDRNREEIKYLLLDAAWARLHVWPFLFTIIGPGFRDWKGWEKAFSVFLKRQVVVREEWGPHPKPDWVQAVKRDCGKKQG